MLNNAPPLPKLLLREQPRRELPPKRKPVPDPHRIASQKRVQQNRRLGVLEKVEARHARRRPALPLMIVKLKIEHPEPRTALGVTQSSTLYATSVVIAARPSQEAFGTPIRAQNSPSEPFPRPLAAASPRVDRSETPVSNSKTPSEPSGDPPSMPKSSPDDSAIAHSPAHRRPEAFAGRILYPGPLADRSGTLISI